MTSRGKRSDWNIPQVLLGLLWPSSLPPRVQVPFAPFPATESQLRLFDDPETGCFADTRRRDVHCIR